MPSLGASSPFGPRSDDPPPLVQAIAALARTVLRTVQVRAPIAPLLADAPDPEPGELHEMVARTGILLRAPVALLRWQRRSATPTPLAPPDRDRRA